jgi:hypothetical protein
MNIDIEIRAQVIGSKQEEGDRVRATVLSCGFSYGNRMRPALAAP